MTDVASTTTTPPATASETSPEPSSVEETTGGEITVEETTAQPASESFTFQGSSPNMVPGAALLFGGIMAFSMGMTDVYFAEAIAWTFAIWGLLMIYSGLMDIYTTYEVTEDALIIRNPVRPWLLRRTWDWGRINRLDVIVKRNGAGRNDVVMQVYYTPEGELANEREDRTFSATLAQIIIERAGLSAESGTPASAMDIRPAKKAVYSWR